MIKTFGPNNLTPSKLCFGTMQFGDGASAKDSEEMYLKCRENEVNFFDTAYVYTKGLFILMGVYRNVVKYSHEKEDLV